MTHFCIKKPADGVSFWHPASLIATFVGVGLIRPAPGTWGSLAAVCVLGCTAYISLTFLLIALFLICLIGCWATDFYQTKTQTKDASEIVIDEVIGIGCALSLTQILLPNALTLLELALIFGLFRLFDITKPGLIGWADKNVGGAKGVILDDVLAGIMAGGIYVIGAYAYHAIN